MRARTAVLTLLTTAVAPCLAGCGTSGDEACERAVAAYGSTLEELARDLATEGGSTGEIWCDTDGPGIAVVDVEADRPNDFRAETRRLRDALVSRGWAPGRVDDRAETFERPQDDYSATLETFLDGSISVSFSSPQWSPGS
ncbi:hypothetical protein H1Q78_16705 [Cellulosimicrobium cellulans]|uniref:hypothetical protein n=1 Tax=Cellulosimicrobium cellulans TaxID=1710 RepID=UPI001ED9E220|nr:hypothetical protein [Cellulosimicrobium cellulans]UKJ63292.1 hypothetical protein H1Q78_16705 [Cellulosimicrobium cellulans]